MKAYQTYRRPEPSTGRTRIDILLALYDGAVDRLDRAEKALLAGDRAAALPLMIKAQLIVSELASGVRLEGNEEVGTNLLRLYQFVANELREPRVANVANARKILVTLREGFQAIRTEATDLERAGMVPDAGRLPMVLATA